MAETFWLNNQPMTSGGTANAVALGAIGGTGKFLSNMLAMRRAKFQIGNEEKNADLDFKIKTLQAEKVGADIDLDRDAYKIKKQQFGLMRKMYDRAEKGFESEAGKQAALDKGMEMGGQTMKDMAMLGALNPSTGEIDYRKVERVELGRVLDKYAPSKMTQGQIDNIKRMYPSFSKEIDQYAGRSKDLSIRPSQAMAIITGPTANDLRRNDPKRFKMLSDIADGTSAAPADLKGIKSFNSSALPGISAGLSNKTIRVKIKGTNTTGYVPESEFSDQKYERI